MPKFWTALFAYACILFVVEVRGNAQDEQPRTQYLFKPQAKTPVLLARSPYFYEGRLDHNGDFVPDPNAAPIRMPVDAGPEWIAALEKRKFPIYNLQRATFRADIVYQYVGGRLILGVIPDEGFAPNIEDDNTIKVITMEEYLKTYDPDRHYRIYNLPGRIMAKPKNK